MDNFYVDHRADPVVAARGTIAAVNRLFTGIKLVLKEHKTGSDEYCLSVAVEPTVKDTGPDYLIDDGRMIP